MNNRLRNVFNQLKTIRPDADYSRMAKRLILATPKQSTRETVESLSIGIARRPFVLSLVNTASLVMAVGLLAMGVYVATIQLSPLLLPGLNEKKIVAEADMINQTISIQLAQIEHFKKTARETTSALNNVSTQQLNHLNETVIGTEAQKITQVEDPSAIHDINTEINNILDTISK